MSQLTITTIQTDLKWEDKKANLDMLENKIESINGNTEIVVLPEMFSTGFTMHPENFAENMDGNTIHWMKRLAVRNKIVITGSLIIEEKGEYYNRLIWMLPNGTFGSYDKRHLFAYGRENEYYKSGSKRLIASIKGWKINLQICYDLRFPVWGRQNKTDNTSHEYDLLIYVANWPEVRKNAWITLLQARAIENQCFVAGVNRVGFDGNNIYHAGDSMILDPLGEVLYHADRKEEIHTVTISKNKLDEVRHKFPFWQDADNFLIKD